MKKIDQSEQETSPPNLTNGRPLKRRAKPGKGASHKISMTTAPSAVPFITCIVCLFGEGELLQLTLESLREQSFEQFEVLLVDDGASEVTRAVLDRFLNAAQDPRFRVIRQSNDGLSAARNRGLRHARGEYVCFLDGDDSRPPWAFEQLVTLARTHSPDVVFSQGFLSELRGELMPFYDASVFDAVVARFGSQRFFRSGTLEFRELLPMLMRVEPQSANKLVRRALIDELGLVFPSGHFFEDILFHMSLIAGVKSIAISVVPSFTYFRRYGHAQITAASGEIRLDSVAVARLTLSTFAKTGRFSDPSLRAALMIAQFKLLKWCYETSSHYHRYQFYELLVLLVAELDPRYLSAIEENHFDGKDNSEIKAFIEALYAEMRRRKTC